MKTLMPLVRRNIKMFFSDKGLFFTSLITPMILLVLYISFLGNVYRDSLLSSLPEGIPLSERVIDSVVSGQLISSILAVSCVTVSFCSNMLMVQDKVTGARRDFDVSPVSRSTLSLSYYLSTLTSSLIVCLSASVVCLIYAFSVGSYITFFDVLCLILDVLLLTMFGTAISSIVGYFLTSQGQISAIGSIVSSCYGFVCGAYMPISQFSPFLQKVISYLPSTYATSLMRNHALSSSFTQLEKEGVPSLFVSELRRVFDMDVFCNSQKVTIPAMYVILLSTILVLVLIYVLINVLSNRRKGVK